MNMHLEGVEELQKVLSKIPGEVDASTKKVFEEVAQDLKGEAQRRAPKDIGTLRKSAFAEVKISGKKVFATVGFKEPYATRQHETLDYNHTDGEAKYLEKPYKERKDAYVRDIKKAIAGGLSGIGNAG